MNLTSGIRRLRRQPGFTAAVVVTLGLGLGATTGVFAVIDAVLLRPLAHPAADRLVMLEGRFSKLGIENLGASAAELGDYRTARSFAALAAFRSQGYNLAGPDLPERLSAAQVSASLFPLLGTRPQLGQAFSEAEQEPGADGVVVLSDRLWRRAFAADPTVLGRPVRLDGRPRVVVGVMPAGFEFPHPSFRFGPRADLWVPLVLTAEQRADRSTYDLRVIARLRPGVSLASAQADLATVAAALEREHPREYRGPRGEEGGWGVEVVPYRDEVVGDAGHRLAIVLGAIGLLLLVAAANVGGLFVARGLGRRKELALRLALGARRGHLVREALAESLVLAALGGALGLLLAWGGMRLLVALGPASVPRLGEVSLDGRSFAFASLLTLMIGVVFSLLAPLSADDVAVRASLAGEAPQPSSRGMAFGRGRFRQLLVVSQLAVALVLLVDAGLLLRSLHHLLTVESGFAGERRLALALVLPRSHYPEPAQQAAFFGRVLARVEWLPGVAASGLVSQLPLSGPGLTGPCSVEGRPLDTSGPPPLSSYRATSAGYFETMQIALRRGRLLTSDDAPPAAPTAWVNEAMVRQFFAGEEPLGRRLKLGAPSSPRPWLTIVGVVGDVSDGNPGSRPGPEIYVPYPHDPAAAMTLVVRSTGDPGALASALRAAVRAEDPDQAVASVRTLDQVREAAVAPQRLAASLLAGVALLALALTAVGVYGVAAQLAAQRARELGIRVALGAERRDLLRMLVSQSLALALMGAALGLVGALASTRLLASLLAGVAPTDPPTFVASAAGLVALTLFAGWLPARRASRLDPVQSLRRD